MTRRAPSSEGFRKPFLLRDGATATRVVQYRRLLNAKVLRCGLNERLLTSHSLLYSQRVLTIASRLDVMNRLGRAMADPTRSRILLSLLDAPGYPAQLSQDLGLTRTNVSNHLACLRDCGIVVTESEGRQTRYEIADAHLTQALNALVATTLAVDEDAGCINPECSLPGCAQAGTRH